MPAHPDEFLWRGRRESPMTAAEKAVGLVLFVAACAASLFAVLSYEVMCVRYEGTVACAGRATEWAWHLALSLIGLVASGFTLNFAFRGPRLLFCTLLLVSLAVYVSALVLADAGTHGWDNLKVFARIG